MWRIWKNPKSVRLKYTNVSASNSSTEMEKSVVPVSVAKRSTVSPGPGFSGDHRTFVIARAFRSGDVTAAKVADVRPRMTRIVVSSAATRPTKSPVAVGAPGARPGGL